MGPNCSMEQAHHSWLMLVVRYHKKFFQRVLSLMKF